MRFITPLLLLCSLFAAASSIHLFEYYAPGGVITEGLKAEGDSFTLNGKEIILFSGAFHYYRVHPDNWRSVLRKMKAAHLNTVETYMPWNLHHPRRDVLDFGNLGEDMSPFLDIRRFVEIAAEEGLYVIIRPGPYVCTEWDFGGLPSWLLRDPAMKVRSSYPGFLFEVTKYYQGVYEQVQGMFYTDGGPIIAIQIENEFGHFGYADFQRDLNYMQSLKNMMDNLGFSPLLYFTADSPYLVQDLGALPGILQTLTFQANASKNYDILIEMQPNRPRMVMEYWTGWFDHWLIEDHVVNINTDGFEQILETIFSYNSSVNFYMFIGGTNFGFLAGANIEESPLRYSPITTSYDYDAPLTESGDYNEKYHRARALIQERNPLFNIVDTIEIPPESEKGEAETLPVLDQLDFESLIKFVPDRVELTNGPINMEALDINDGNGQSYGYILYQTTIDLNPGTNEIKIKGHVRDVAQVFVNGREVTKKYSQPSDLYEFGFWQGRNKTLQFEASGGPSKVQILVENLGRANFGKPHYFDQRKGLWEGPVSMNQVEIKNWTAIPFEFKSKYVNILTGWQSFSGDLTSPSAYRVEYDVEEPKDIYIDTRDWVKGVVFLNGFNLGRYWTQDSPVKTMYVPAPLLRSGVNEFVVFEQYTPSDNLKLISSPIYGPNYYTNN